MIVAWISPSIIWQSIASLRDRIAWGDSRNSLPQLPVPPDTFHTVSGPQPEHACLSMQVLQA